MRASCSCGWAAWYGEMGMVPAAAAEAAWGMPHEQPGKDAAAYWDMAEAVETQMALDKSCSNTAEKNIFDK